MARVTITPDNRTPIVEIVIWFTLVVSILTILIRFAVKLRVLRKFNLDDHFAAISLVFAVAQSIALSIATANGLGQRINSLSALQLNSQQKADYASTFLFIASVCFAKLSLVAFLRALTPSVPHKKAALFIALAVVIWALTSLATTAAQCHLPRPWDHIHNACFNRKAWANYISITNILTDLALVVLPIVIVSQIKITMGKKITLSLVFMGRLTVVAALICQLIYINQLNGSSDPTFNPWPIAVCTQVVQCMSILTACTTYLKPFLDTLESGFIHMGDLRRQHISGYGYDPDGETKAGSKVSSGGLRGKFMRSQESKNIELVSGISKGDAGEMGHTASARADPHGWEDSNSQSHILQTTTWSVREDRPSEGSDS